MGMEGGMDRRQFLKAIAALGASPLTAALPTFSIKDAEAAQKAKAVERKPEGPKHSFSDKFQFSDRNYGTVKRIERANFRRDVPKNLKIVPHLVRFDVHPNVSGVIKGANITGTESARRAGRLERALRFKNISDAVELRYNLPPGIILAMVMQESNGADLKTNAQNDGGIGLSHMQPVVAQEFGLETYLGNSKLRDKKHGRKLRQIIKDMRHDIFRLAAEVDDRFNRVLNLDAVGRMLATHMGNAPASSGALNVAVLRYAGRYNYQRYWGQLLKRMSELHNPAYLAEIIAGFNARNKNLKINGISASESVPPFALYIESFWRQNERGFDLARYSKLPAYRPVNSDYVMKTWRKDLVKKSR